MKKEKLGQEPAFACESMIDNNGHIQEGISKRFYAACAAMQGLCSNPAVTAPGNLDFQKIINSAYMLADELLKQENND